ncbi:MULTISPECIES: hypothetical protein [Blautia]|uniref:hypothetical protein n=1 Tax=Blautia TaxID=572511 RepID=UPI000BA3FD8D|nr:MULTISPECIES: hypothetical protein [Blautia]
MECPKCKTQLDSKDIYCSECGFVFDDVDDSRKIENDTEKIELKYKLLLLFLPVFVVIIWQIL